MSRSVVRVYGHGHCDVEAEAPEEYRQMTGEVLQGCVRLTSFVDPVSLIARLISRGVPPDAAIKIAETAKIFSDDAFFSPSRD